MKTLATALLILSASTWVVSSCGETKRDYSQEVDEGSFDGNTYHSATLGWTMKFPEDWTITSKKSLESLDERSKLASGDTSSDMSGIKRLLAFQKNFNNNFSSTMENFQGQSESNYRDIIHQMHETIYNNYLDQRTGMDTVSGTLKIGKVTFDQFQISLYDKTGKNFANQMLLTSVVNNQFMAVTIVYDNEADKTKILNLFKESSFE